MLLMWAILELDKSLGGGALLFTSLITMVYLAVLLLIFFWLTPKSKLILVAVASPPLIKLALVFNYVTLLLLLHMAVTAWFDKALVLAAMFIISAIAFHGFLQWLWPAFCLMGDFWGPNAGARFYNTTGAQGRRARYDEGAGR